jgi:hypothetical protein
MAVVLTADANPGVASWSTSLSEVAPVAVVADPGTGAAIPVTASEAISLSIALGASETNTIAAPSFAGQELLLAVGVLGPGGSRTIGPFPAGFDSAGNTNIEFDGANQCAMFKAFRFGVSFRWILVVNQGATLSP